MTYLFFENKADCIAANNKIGENKGFPVYAKDKDGNPRLDTKPTARYADPKQDKYDVWFIKKPKDEFIDGVIFASEAETVERKEVNFENI